MIDLASLLLGGAALLVHVALMVVAAPLAGSCVAFGARLASARGLADAKPTIAGWPDRLAQPFQEIVALLAKEPVRAGNASPLAVAAPRFALGLTLVAACLVPSFAVGLLDAPLADLLLILGLLGGAQAVLLLAAADDGLAVAGLEAVGQTVNGLLAVPGGAMAALALSLLAGGTGLDQILASQHGGGRLMSPDPAGLAAASALGLAAIAATGRRVALSQGWSGPDLAVFRVHDGLQILVWIDLIGGLALPGTLAAAQSGPLGWLAGLLLWAIRLVLGCLLLGAIGARLTTVASRRRLAGLSLLLAVLAPILLLAGRAFE